MNQILNLNYHCQYVYPSHQGESSYCPANPKNAKYVLAEPEDLQIVCRVHNVGPVPESETEDEEIVITVTGFANHPEFEVGEKGSSRFTEGSYKGSDISVYHVDDRNLRLEEGKPWLRKILCRALMPNTRLGRTRIHKTPLGRARHANDVLHDWGEPVTITMYCKLACHNS